MKDFAILEMNSQNVELDLRLTNKTPNPQNKQTNPQTQTPSMKKLYRSHMLGQRLPFLVVCCLNFVLML